jgi:hypothetical protein
VSTRARNTADVVEDVNVALSLKADYATPFNDQSGSGSAAYTFALADGTRVTASSASAAKTFIIPPQASVTWPNNTIIRVVNYGAGALTIAGGLGVTVTNTASSLIQFQAGAAIRTGSDAWTLVPFGVSDFSAIGGNEVATVGSYRYHLFTSTSAFVVESGKSDCEIAVIGAGGGGGRWGAGGGGGAKEPASGYTTQNLSAGSYTVTVASGGIGALTINVKGGTPSDTSFAGTSTITAKGGGGGGTAGSETGANGGSGGGGSGAAAAATPGGTASGSNTNAGGTASPSAPNYGSGGGGGATAVGGNGTSTAGGNGGAGLALSTIDANLTSANFSTFSGMTVISSGGGGGCFRGGTGGTGGTGAGNGTNSNNTGGNATAFGAGGGGGGNAVAGDGLGGNGYGGLVIVRYRV